MFKKHNYTEMENRVKELEALFELEIVKFGKADLLIEHCGLCDKLDTRDFRNRIISILVYYPLLFLMGFVFAVSLLL